MKFSPEDRSGCWSWPEWAARFPSQGLSPERTRRTRAQSGWWWACDGNDDGDEEGKKKDRNVQQQSDGLVYNVGDQGGRDVGQCEHGWHGGHGSESDNDGRHLCIEDLAHIDADVEADRFVSQQESKLPVLQSREGGESYHHYRIVVIIVVVIITTCE